MAEPAPAQFKCRRRIWTPGDPDPVVQFPGGAGTQCEAVARMHSESAADRSLLGYDYVCGSWVAAPAGIKVRHPGTGVSREYDVVQA